MKKYWLFSILCLVFISCHAKSEEKSTYPKDSTVSNLKGELKDSLGYYYPEKIRVDTQTVKTGMDPFMQNWYSSALYAAREPILYNYYLGHDIYRLLWLRSFHRPVVISLHKEGDLVWLTIKELNKQPDFMVRLPPIKFVAPKRLKNGELIPPESIHPKEKKEAPTPGAGRTAELILNKTIHLSWNEWNEFENILTSCSFWTMKNLEKSDGLDGSEWTIEGHLKTKYWFVNRWTPHDNFRKAGLYLIQKSGFKEEIY